MRAAKIPRMLCVSFVVLAARGAYTADKPDPVPDNAYFPPGTATAGTADPGPALNRVPISAAMRAGQGPDCNALSPCAVDSPPLERLPPH